MTHVKVTSQLRNAEIAAISMMETNTEWECAKDMKRKTGHMPPAAHSPVKNMKAEDIRKPDMEKKGLIFDIQAARFSVNGAPIPKAGSVKST